VDVGIQPDGGFGVLGESVENLLLRVLLCGYGVMARINWGVTVVGS